MVAKGQSYRREPWARLAIGRAEDIVYHSMPRQRQVPIKWWLAEDCSNRVVGIPLGGSWRLDRWKKRKKRSARDGGGRKAGWNVRARAKRMSGLAVSWVYHDNLCKRQFVRELRRRRKPLLLHGIHDTAGYAL